MKTRIFNSSLYLLTAYYIVHLIYLGSQNIILNLLGMKKVQLFFFYNSYVIDDSSWWSRVKVFLVCGTGFVFVVLTLLIVLILFIKLSRKKYKLHTFYNWLIIVCSGFIVAEFFAIPFYDKYTNMYHILRWSGFEHGGGGIFVVSIMFLLIVPFVAYRTNNNFLRMGNSTQFIRSKPSRLIFYFKTTLIPFFILSFVLFLMINVVYSYEMGYIMSREVMRMFIIGSIIVFGSFFVFNKNYISIQKSNNTHILNVPLSLFLIVAMSSIFFILYLNLE